MEGKEDWGGLLDKLSEAITPSEDAALRRLAADGSDPCSLSVRMHHHVAGLLVGHRLATWGQLHASFPGEALPSRRQNSPLHVHDSLFFD